MRYLRRRRGRTDIVIIVPVRARTNWPCGETTAAIRADVAQHRLDAVAAERALETADHRVDRFRWQRAVAVFAGGTELQGHAPECRPSHGDTISAVNATDTP